MEETRSMILSDSTAPKSLNEKELVGLCRKYAREIDMGVKNGLPKIRIRYVLDNKKFGFADFGDYFFWADDGLYVWHKEEKYAEDRNPDAVDDFFGTDCQRRGYTVRHIFAGIDTGFDDDEGSRMFTGDVVRVTDSDGSDMGALCLASAGWGGGCYCFPLDNSSLTLQMCKEGGYHLKRIGTIFYQLNDSEEPEPIWNKALLFNNNRWTKEELEQHLVMAQYTPNYYQEVWQYLAYEIIGAEPFWNV